MMPLILPRGGNTPILPRSEIPSTDGDSREKPGVRTDKCLQNEEEIRSNENPELKKMTQDLAGGDGLAGSSEVDCTVGNCLVRD